MMSRQFTFIASSSSDALFTIALPVFFIAFIRNYSIRIAFAFNTRSILMMWITKIPMHTFLTQASHIPLFTYALHIVFRHSASLCKVLSCLGTWTRLTTTILQISIIPFSACLTIDSSCVFATLLTVTCFFVTTLTSAITRTGKHITNQIFK